MEYRTLGDSQLKVSVVSLGTWVMGGWLWGGAEDRESLASIRRSIDLGINLIDTAPIYGHGRSEELVGQAVEESGLRDRLVIATKTGLRWTADKKKVWRDSSRDNIVREVEASLRRLRTEYIDLYQIHWPDTSTPFEKTMEALQELIRAGKIRYIGLSNFSKEQMDCCGTVGKVHTLQPPYNLFERGVESDILPYCRAQGIGVLAYGPLCRGLLTGKFLGNETFPAGDIRAVDPKFHNPAFREYCACTKALQPIADRYNKTLAQLAIRWCLDQPGITVALCGTRTVTQLEESAVAAGWKLAQQDLIEIDRIVLNRIQYPLGPEFMAPA